MVFKVIITGAFLLWRTLITSLSFRCIGASGFLGTVLHEAFKSCKRDEEIVIKALSHSRGGPDLVQIDLLDSVKVKEVFGEFRPDCWFICVVFFFE
jgi:dTDP-4-dehydrorhamnose reductase